MIGTDAIEVLLPGYLPRQRWYAGDVAPRDVEIRRHRACVDGLPSMEWLLADVVDHDGATATYQLYVGARPADPPAEFLKGKDAQILGVVETGDGPWVVYDAVVDADLVLGVMADVAPTEEASLARPITVEQSNTSIVYDERLILKLFRRIHDGANPDVEVTAALEAAGFDHVAPTVARRRDGASDLAVVRRYLLGAADGWQLALTSLRDLFGSRVDPADAGGDFGPEAHRLGEITGQLHLRMAELFGVGDAEPGGWVDDMIAHLARVAGAFDRAEVAARYERLRELAGAGRAIRIHGDLHLGQTMHADDGWYLLDFEGEPARPLAERTRPSSPLRDIAGMVRSFHYAAAAGLVERRTDSDAGLIELAQRWEERASSSFIGGYHSVPGVDDLLPDASAARVVQDAFELDKAVYEVGYELAHRPDWVHIPIEAIDRILAPRPQRAT